MDLKPTQRALLACGAALASIGAFAQTAADSTGANGASGRPNMLIWSGTAITVIIAAVAMRKRRERLRQK